VQPQPRSDAPTANARFVDQAGIPILLIPRTPSTNVRGRTPGCPVPDTNASLHSPSRSVLELIAAATQPPDPAWSRELPRVSRITAKSKRSDHLLSRAVKSCDPYASDIALDSKREEAETSPQSLLRRAIPRVGSAHPLRRSASGVRQHVNNLGGTSFDAKSARVRIIGAFCRKSASAHVCHRWCAPQSAYVATSMMRTVML
jgi:hypothetical protein